MPDPRESPALGGCFIFNARLRFSILKKHVVSLTDWGTWPSLRRKGCVVTKTGGCLERIGEVKFKRRF